MLFFKYTATTEIYTYGHTLSLHDALPICLDLVQARGGKVELRHVLDRVAGLRGAECLAHHPVQIDQLVMAQQVVDFYLPSAVQHGKPFESRLLVGGVVDRKSTRLNSSH